MEELLKYASLVLFDTMSNAQKLPWKAVEENCRDALEAVEKVLKTLQATHIYKDVQV